MEAILKVSLNREKNMEMVCWNFLILPMKELFLMILCKDWG